MKSKRLKFLWGLFDFLYSLCSDVWHRWTSVVCVNRTPCRQVWLLCSIIPSIYLFVYPSCLPLKNRAQWDSSHFQKWRKKVSRCPSFSPSHPSFNFVPLSLDQNFLAFLLFFSSLLSHGTIFLKSLWLLMSPASLLYVYVRVCARTNTHISVGLCCLTAIHHHFISLNWMPSGPLKLHISSLTNSCSLHTQRDTHWNTPNTQTRFSLTALMYAFFSH